MHEITVDDGAVFNKVPAWHGLGYTVDTAMSPEDALRLAGLDWTVFKSTGIRADNLDIEATASSDRFCAVIRNDTNNILSVQSPDYQLVQNHEVFNLAYSLGANVKVESALSLQGGKKIVCLLRGDSFAPSNSHYDVITKYFALISSHDGSIALTGLPTSVRVVCMNTLRMAINSAKTGNRFTHIGNMEQKKYDMSQALANYTKTGEVFQETVNHLSKTLWTTEQLQRFFVSVYEKLWKTIPVTTSSQSTATHYDNEDDYSTALDAATKIGVWCSNFDQEREELTAPPSAWQAVNAVTKYIQHHSPSRGRKPTMESRAYSNLLGSNQNDSVSVMKLALAHS